MLSTIFIALLSSAANAQAPVCRAVDGGGVCVEPWVYRHDGEVQSRWKDLNIHCVESCELTIVDNGDSYTIWDGEGVTEVPARRGELAVLYIDGSPEEDEIYLVGVDTERALVSLSDEDTLRVIE